MAKDETYTGKLTKPSWYSGLYKSETGDRTWGQQARFLDGVSVKLAENFPVMPFTKGDGVWWRVTFQILPGEGSPAHLVYATLKMLTASDPQALEENRVLIHYGRSIWRANEPVRRMFAYVHFRGSCNVSLGLTLKNERSLEWRSPIMYDYVFDYAKIKDPRSDPTYIDNAFERIVEPIDMLKQTVRLKFRGSQYPEEYSFKNFGALPPNAYSYGSIGGGPVVRDTRYVPLLFRRKKSHAGTSIVEPVIGEGSEASVYFSPFTTPRIYPQLKAHIDQISNAVLEALPAQARLLKIIQTRAESRLLHEVPEGLDEAGVLRELPGARFGLPYARSLKIGVGANELAEARKVILETLDEERSVSPGTKPLDAGTSERGVTRKPLTADEYKRLQDLSRSSPNPSGDYSIE